MKNNKGQSTAEFILAFAFMALFVIVFIQMAENYVKGYAIHYATFMTSRSFMVQDNGADSISSVDLGAKNFAESKVLRKMLKVNNKMKFQFRDPGSGGKKLFSGTTITFSESFSPSEMVGGVDKVKFVSESFLGRTFSSAECARNTCLLLEKTISGGSLKCNSGHMTVFDNGC
tara:strand:+ start:1549 stop:2067 length:519 start_codon:yes stop_codon:yes gene_type:complete